jgi:hypothetical protein
MKTNKVLPTKLNALLDLLVFKVLEVALESKVKAGLELTFKLFPNKINTSRKLAALHLVKTHLRLHQNTRREL